jgi:hypothetical protein
VIHLYAFVLGARGVDELELVRLGSVEAVVGTEAVDAVGHGLVVESLVERCDSVLPVRFGESFADEEALRVAVSPRLEALQVRLEELAGCVEVGVRVAAPESPLPAGSGSDYLRSLGEREGAIGGLDRRLRSRARDAVVRRRAGGQRETGYLLDRTDVAEFAAEVERYAAAHPDLAVICTGPWAPYSFAA